MVTRVLKTNPTYHHPRNRFRVIIYRPFVSKIVLARLKILLLGLRIVFICILDGRTHPDLKKHHILECGFTAFSLTRNTVRAECENSLWQTAPLCTIQNMFLKIFRKNILINSPCFSFACTHGYFFHNHGKIYLIFLIA